MIKGMKRYILTKPSSCRDLSIIGDPTHPFYRHSTIDWSNTNTIRKHNFAKVDSMETILKEGEVLYIPR